jgi:hypothetical protein
MDGGDHRHFQPAVGARLTSGLRSTDARWVAWAMPSSDVDRRLDRLEEGLATLIDMVCRNLFGDQRSDISPGIAVLADQLLELATEIRDEHNPETGA